ncbi:Polysaccharide deacetylase [Pelosinus fermentans]|uniref:polysaccharide deacetylase family protein n=1 Tax=Pelosinus fermentans TaxID=365349 RepID=UPI00026863DA|nr:polysaccharide deacetylase family protein [Pelosinus fermentans]OAM96533.1 polysaccharide deacetylase [Pelosinus fermentans DSM 17108]SDR41115.1 Polysaccharide deacetylase [Pelosinus fermentans]
MISRRRFIKGCISAIVAVSGSQLLFQAPTSSGSGNRNIPVLVYHRVGYTTDALTVTPERFSSDLDSLQERGYYSISLEQFQNFLDDRNVEMPERPVLITFDDGYLDNFEHAYPILRKHGMVGSFFVITDMLWTQDRLSPENIVEMSQGGMSFGSHTMTHRDLGALDPEAIRDELVNSKAALESVLGKTVNGIAYPRGSYNETVVNIAKEVGYVTGLTVREGICIKESPDLELRRIPIFKYDSGIIHVIANRGQMNL